MPDKWKNCQTVYQSSFEKWTLHHADHDQNSEQDFKIMLMRIMELRARPVGFGALRLLKKCCSCLDESEQPLTWWHMQQVFPCPVTSEVGIVRVPNP